MAIIRNELCQIVGAIGFTIANSSKTSMHYSLFSYGSMRVWCMDDNDWLFAEFTSYDDLEQKLLTSIVKFEIRAPGTPRTRRIDNPYYGCKSLEEAMIRKDLIANGS